MQLLQLQKLLLNVYLTDLCSTGFIETEIVKCASLYGTYKIISMQKEECNIFKKFIFIKHYFHKSLILSGRCQYIPLCWQEKQQHMVEEERRLDTA